MRITSLRSTLSSIVVVMLVGCGGGGSDGIAGGSSLTARIGVSLEAPGSNCTAGGSKITAGLDANGNGVLDAGEIATTQYVCNGTAGAAGLSGATGVTGAAGAAGATGPAGPAGSAGFNALVAMLAEPAGANCATGGKKMNVGLDANRNNVLDAGEVSSSAYLCNGANGTGGAANGSNGLTNLLSVVAEPAGANCIFGGSRISSGLDANASGVLDAAEVTSTSYVCKSVATLVALATEAAGVNCTSGGSKISTGLDTNVNGVLDSAEVVNTQYVCNGSTGAAGTAGVTGFNALVAMASEAPGSNCPTGGKKISTGLDSNRNSVLDSGEVTSTSYVCNGANGANGANGSTGAAGANGANGADGSNGLNSLFSITVEPAGANCVGGGSKIVSGVDANRNGVLDGSEATTTYVCNGVNGAAGAPGPGVTWVDDMSGTIAAQSNTGYVLHASTSSILLPGNPSIGDTVEIAGTGAGGWTIQQNPGQFVLTDSIGGFGAVWSAREAVRAWRAVASSADGSKLLAAVTNGRLYTSTDSGNVWTPREAPRTWTAVASSADGSKLVAAEDGGRLYTSTDSGASWTPRENPAGRHWVAVASSADGSRLAAAAAPAIAGPEMIYISADSGITWTPRAAARSWISIAMSADGFTLVAGVSGGQIWTSNDAGTSWYEEPNVPPGTWSAAAASADGRYLIACAAYDRCYTSNDYSSTWTARDRSANWQSVASSADGQKLIAAANGGEIYTSTDFGASWTPRIYVSKLPSVAISADGSRLVASYSGGQIFTSRPATTTGLSGSISGAAYGALELVYIGGGAFNVTGHEGSFTLH